MPNHMHGIVTVDGSGAGRYADRGRAAAHPRTLGMLINLTKGAVTRAVRHLPGCEGLRVWQGRYHDHIIRSERSLSRIREYVLANPSRWHADTFFADL
jgi:hypothetical protein